MWEWEKWVALTHMQAQSAVRPGCGPPEAWLAPAGGSPRWLTHTPGALAPVACRRSRFPSKWIESHLSFKHDSWLPREQVTHEIALWMPQRLSRPSLQSHPPSVLQYSVGYTRQPRVFSVEGDNTRVGTTRGWEHQERRLIWGQPGGRSPQ